jgi:tetratricopeptide (TPR) repeat protein
MTVANLTTRLKGMEAETRPMVGVSICLVLAVWVVFGQTAGFGFVDYDDFDYVFDNPTVTQGLTAEGFVWAFTGSHSANWHPLTWLSHMLDCELYGLNAGGHHVTNVLLHTATVLALFLVLRQLTGALWRSAFVAAVFAIHPLRVESVVWVAERKDVLSGLFFILTIWAYVRYARRAWSPVRYGLVLLLFVSGLMSKPMLVTLPLVLLLLDYWPLRRMESRKFWGLVGEKLPLLALSVAGCVVTIVAQRGAIQAAEPHSLFLRVDNALAACMIYLGQMVWPSGLAVLYLFPQNGPPIWEIALAALLLAGISVVAWRTRRTQPWLLMGWLWYLVMLLPVLGIIQVGAQAHADRYTYLPQIGIYVAVTWLVAERAMSRVVLAGLMAGVLVALMVCAWIQTGYWKNDETLWRRDLACTTDNYIAHYNLGFDLFKRGRVDEAITHYQAAIYNIKPDFADVHYNFGIALLQKNRTNEAIAQYERALQINPNHAGAHNNLGDAFLLKGKVEEAIAQFQKALKIDPNYAKAQKNLGNAFLHRGGVDEAIVLYQKALETEPDSPETRYNLGNALLQKGRTDEAIAQYRQALEIKPRYAEAEYNLGIALFQKGRVDETIGHYEAALQMDPDYADAHINLGNALLQKGNVDEAIAHFQKVLKIKPDDATAHNDLGNALLRKRNMRDAISHFQQALQFKPGDPSIQNNLAWLLATCQEAGLRNGNKAVELAQQANTLTGEKNPVIFHTLAAAFAETGRFGDAVRNDQKAIELARAAGRQDMVEQLTGELKRYEAGLPFRQ